MTHDQLQEILTKGAWFLLGSQVSIWSMVIYLKRKQKELEEEAKHANCLFCHRNYRKTESESKFPHVLCSKECEKLEIAADMISRGHPSERSQVAGVTTKEGRA